MSLFADQSLKARGALNAPVIGRVPLSGAERRPAFVYVRFVEKTGRLLFTRRPGQFVTVDHSANWLTDHRGQALALRSWGMLTPKTLEAIAVALDLYLESGNAKKARKFLNRVFWTPYVGQEAS